MKTRYEGLLVLNVKGSEESAKEIIERLEGDFKKEGITVEQVQKMDRRNFTYVAGPLQGGYYVNFVIAAEPQAIEKARAKFKLDEEVYRQQYTRLRRGRPTKPRGPKLAAPAAA
jgi:ribosomal protein S6